MLLAWPAISPAADGPVFFEDGAQQLFIKRCGECHGENRTRRKAELDLRTAAAVLKGGESGPAVVPGKPDESPLWALVSRGEMPPKESGRLAAGELDVIRKWIVDGARTRVKAGAGDVITAEDRDFWSFRNLARPSVPEVASPQRAANPIDRFLLARLDARGLTYSPPADRAAWLRRVTFDLTGLPPTPDEVRAFLADASSDADARLVDRLLESPRYGERWGRHWLDVAGYSDSNGYHRADTVRPLAWRYRDYVIRAFNEDKPYDRFWLEQLAGDELVDRDELTVFSPEVVDRLVATHFLRNGPDGTDSTEGNEMARTIERYAVLEQQLQITMSSMFALTIDCARCHSHKFDPIPQTDYYALQAVFYPAFNVRNWVQPKNRSIHLASAAQLAAWEAGLKETDRKIERLKRDFAAWIAANRTAGTVVFRDDFNQTPATLAPRWSNTAPGDDGPAGSPAVNVDSAKAPAARIADGRLQIIESGGPGSWLVTRDKFDWTPDREGAWIQASFDLVADRLPSGGPAERIGFYVALHDYSGNGGVPGGNVLFDGNPAGGASVTVAYPGARANGRGKVGASGYKPGHTYGVRITNAGDGKFRVEQLVDWVPEEPVVTLSAADLPDGGFGFEYCCGRSFVVDDVTIETGEAASEGAGKFAAALKTRREALTQAIQQEESARPEEAGRDRVGDGPFARAAGGAAAQAGPLFRRGGAGGRRRRERVVESRRDASPGAARVRGEDDRQAAGLRPLGNAAWVAPAAMLARVQVNRIWMGHFGRGLVETPENFGHRGQPPSHPELLEWLAARFADNGWSAKAIHRDVVLSNAYRQGTHATPRALEVDPENRLLWGYPVHRLESEAVRDAMLAVAGALDAQIGGPAVEYTRTPEGASLVASDLATDPKSSSRRTVYLRHRRSEPITFLQTFDQATAEPNCVRRSASTVVSQTLAMLNSRFADAMAERFAARVAGDDAVARAWMLAYGRPPDEQEASQATDFLGSQAARYRESGSTEDAATKSALVDLCQALLASNEFVYLR